MTEKQFVINKIDAIVERFPLIKCLYEFDSFDDTHYIKIESSNGYSEELINFEFSIVDKFIEKYPYSGIVFLRDGDVVKIENPMYTKTGVMFNIVAKIKYNILQTENVVESEIPQSYSDYNSDKFSIPSKINIKFTFLSRTQKITTNIQENIKFPAKNKSIAA